MSSEPSLSAPLPFFDRPFTLPPSQTGVISIGPFFALDERPRALKVDVVSEHGSKWVKVKAMSGKGIEDLYEGRGRWA